MKFFAHLSLLLLCSCTATMPYKSPAHRAAQGFMRGVNLANYLEAGAWGRVPHTVGDLGQIRAQGFDHIRLPVAWSRYTGPSPDYKLSADIFGLADNMVTNATKLGLNVIVNLHNFNALNTDPAANTNKFFAIWRQVATHYAHEPAGVAFELLNEPHDAATTAVMNPIYAEAIRQIRLTNPHRTIVVGPGDWNSADELANLRLPENDHNIIVTFHCYEPFFFTHQGAGWAGPDEKITGIQFPGPPKTPLEPDPNLKVKKYVLDRIKRYNTLPTENNPSSPRAFLPKIEEAKAWSEESGRPIYLGEFGAYTKADQESRARFYGAMRQALDSAGFGWAIWDWKSGFNYWDRKKQQPLPGMREALFPDKQQKAAQSLSSGLQH